MTPVRIRAIRILTVLALGWLCSLGVMAQEEGPFDTLFSELVRTYGPSQSHADALLEKIRALEPTFTPDQNEQYQLTRVHSLGDRGKHEERVAAVEALYVSKSTGRNRVSVYQLIALPD